MSMFHPLGMRSEVGRKIVRVVLDLDKFYNYINQHGELPIMKISPELVVEDCSDELRALYNNDERIEYRSIDGIYDCHFNRVSEEVLAELREKAMEYEG